MSLTEISRDAALHVAARARDAEECRLLLDMLGLLPASGNGMHGRFRHYAKGCRCEKCRAANAKARRIARARSTADPSRADRAGHGKASTYRNHNCRCDACRRAHAEQTAANLARKRVAA